MIMDFLKKELAPITEHAWEDIKDQAKNMLSSLLTARKVVDVKGPYGWDLAGVNTGRLNDNLTEKNGVNFGIRQYLPLTEIRVPFELNIWELDNIERGAMDIDYKNMEEAANKLARFEDRAVFYGLSEAGILGLKSLETLENLEFPADGNDFLKMLTNATSIFQTHFIGGPFSLVVNPDKLKKINTIFNGYPLIKQIKNIIGGQIIMSPFIEDAFLISERGGDFEFTLGKDISIGYLGHDSEKVKLYFTESFTFRILEDKGVITITG
jgi:uncharacterized linocin/CFP29 family protein